MNVSGRMFNQKKAQKSQNENDFGFKTKSSQSDMTLIVGGVPLFVNKAVLEMFSPVLKKIFDEKLQDMGKIIRLDDEDTEGFIEFLACFYPSCVHEVVMSNAVRILPFAFKYKVDRLMSKSVALLMTSLAQNPADEHIYRCLSIAKQHSIPTVEKKCMESLVDMYKTDIQRADEILTLEAEVKPVVTSAMIPLLRSEASKYRFLAAGPKGRDRYMDLDDFQDAKYSVVSFKVSFDDVVSGHTKTVSSFHLGDVNVNIQMNVDSFRPYNGFAFSFTTSEYRNVIFAVKMAVENSIPGKDAIWKQDKSNDGLYISFTRGDVETDGSRGNDKVTFVAHVLLNKPTYIVPRTVHGPMLPF